ncbi:hypothetical protein TNCV_938431 [Trichonephila clavipes]|nr:hypothetical protein TNCV_938431 [Trichonephila clavipes]
MASHPSLSPTPLGAEARPMQVYDKKKFTEPKHIHLQSSPLGQRYTSASVRVTSGSTPGSCFSQPPVRPPAKLLAPHLMTQNGVTVNVSSLIGTDKSHTELSLVNRGDVGARYGEFWRGTLLPIEINALVSGHVENTSRHFNRTYAIYDECIPSNDVFEKCVASVICASVW